MQKFVYKLKKNHFNSIKAKNLGIGIFLNYFGKIYKKPRFVEYLLLRDVIVPFQNNIKYTLIHYGISYTI